jgi:hypothetical protein
MPTTDRNGCLLADGTGDSIVNERGMNGGQGKKSSRVNRAQLTRQRRTRMRVGLTSRDRAPPTVSIASYGRRHLIETGSDLPAILRPMASGSQIGFPHGRYRTCRISARAVPHLSISRTVAAVLSAILRCRGKPCDCVRRDMITQSHFAGPPSALYVRHRTAEC